MLSNQLDPVLVVMLKRHLPVFYNHFFHNISLLENVFLGPSASARVITQFDHCG